MAFSGIVGFVPGLSFRYIPLKDMDSTKTVLRSDFLEEAVHV
jgi:hypothetical protein